MSSAGPLPPVGLPFRAATALSFKAAVVGFLVTLLGGTVFALLLASL